MRIQGMVHQDVYELSMDSVCELIANAIAHRSYLVPGGVQVAFYDNRLEITSPGMLVNGVSIEKMKAVSQESSGSARSMACLNRHSVISALIFG